MESPGRATAASSKEGDNSSAKGSGTNDAATATTAATPALPRRRDSGGRQTGPQATPAEQPRAKPKPGMIWVANADQTLTEKSATSKELLERGLGPSAGELKRKDFDEKITQHEDECTHKHSIDSVAEGASAKKDEAELNQR